MASVSGRPRRSETSAVGKTRTTRAGPGSAKPRSEKAAATYDHLVSTAGELLSEIGFEKLTTNAICKRAGITPPALYRYFSNKYEIVEVLGERLLKRLGDAFAIWLLENRSGALLDKPATSIADWYRRQAEIIAAEPGGGWTMRALRAMPNLAHVRIESHRELANRLLELYRQVMPEAEPELLWSRIRIWVEVGWIVAELALEEDLIPDDFLFREVAEIVEGPAGPKRGAD